MRRAGLFLAWLAGAVALAPAAAADEAPALRAMHEGLRAYYAGERTAALVALAVGVLALGVGLGLARRGGALARGLGWSLLGFGALNALGAGSYTVALSGTIARYEALFAGDPAAYQREELAHLRGVTSRFTPIRGFDLTLVVAGAVLAAAGFSRRRATWQGLGLGVSVQALALLGLETVNYERARVYQERIAGFVATASASSSTRDARDGGRGHAIRGA